jgi:hypothetical protein
VGGGGKAMAAPMRAESAANKKDTARRLELATTRTIGIKSGRHPMPHGGHPTL